MIEPDGNYAFISAVFGHFEHLPDSVDGGWTNENVIAVLDLETGKHANSFSLDGPLAVGAANPWGLDISEDGRFLAVAGSGTDEVHLLNLPKVINILDTYPLKKNRPPGKIAVSNQAMQESQIPVKIRIPAGAKGIRRVAVHGNRIYFNSYFEDMIGCIDAEIREPVVFVQNYNPYVNNYPDLNDVPYQEGRLIFHPLSSYEPFQGMTLHRSAARLGPKPVWTNIRRGEMLFHDAMICRLQWQSCFSCHPDGRADSLNWDLLNDGQNNAKNTKSLLLAHETPPCMASGVRKDAETAVRSGIINILFNEISDGDYCALDEYLKSLEPVPSPFLVDGKLTESALRGKRLFEGSKAGCAQCHPAPYFTDFEKHDVGTTVYQAETFTIRDYFNAYDTPALVEVWRTAPYLHDGRYLTVKELIVRGNHFAPDNRLKKLTEQETDDLVEYVLSL
ncbi:hypothetical protein AGMMS50229_21040 [Campylobacterota bacterium]|nr:hypothetical protein AGMMS50229_21040 [Campylobacterota bacterium]